MNGKPYKIGACDTLAKSLLGGVWSESSDSDRDEARAMKPTYQYVPVPSGEHLNLCRSRALSVVSRGAPSSTSITI